MKKKKVFIHTRIQTFFTNHMYELCHRCKIITENTINVLVHHKISKYHTILGNDVVMTILCNIAWYAWMLFSPEIGWHG